ncbi:serine-rich adhesin for platelets-like isoform X1 [Portunus trituberculatus]|uniref:serine-rich adhesin for platelets-like isoform X1 n=1 Tax=Portunus trituberculatus TaxID=210409 RepID=UPI001E1CEE13|nr:serine-rich adhesin for platelets-like isoform X1 [Portunus trituberculatus]
MAPISGPSSSDQGLPDSFWTFELPITRRGHFFQDSAFENAYEQLNNNVRRILQQWGETDFLSELSSDSKLSHSNSLDHFRQLRRDNLREEDQAVTVASDATTYKIVMDVHDFLVGDVKVRVESERELVVEGRTETKTGSWTSSSNSFRRRFCLPPNTDLAAVSAVLSDDGILTVSAPLKNVAREQKQTEVPVVVQDARAAPSSDQRAGFSSLNTNSTQKCTCRLGQQVQSGAARSGREHIIPIKLDEDLEETSRRSPASMNMQATRDSQSQDFMSQEKVESSEKGTYEASRQSQRAESFSASSRASSVASQLSSEKKDKTQSFSTHHVPINTRNQLPITRRGLFFDDSFFAGMRQDFQSAVNEVLGRWGNSEMLMNDRDDASCLGRYKELREHSLNVESQAVTITADETSHKIVIDVHNFLNGDVRVRVEGEREVVVEGSTDTKTDDLAVSSNSFRRRFCLPANTDTAAMSAVISDDGILTITAPRLVKQVQSRETTIPIRTEGVQQKREDHVTSSFSATSGSCSSAACCPSNTSSHTSTVSTQTDPPISGLNQSTIKENKQTKTEVKESSSILKGSEKQSISEAQRSGPDCVTLPITTRGSFFSDDFFKDAWKDFQEAVSEVVSKWGDPACPADDFTHYRSLREQDLRDENQAVKLTDDKVNYKVVVDVQDFMKGGNVTVRSVQDRELVVEGDVERQQGGERYKKQFHRRFVLPSNIYSESVSSVISADGVLTITARKKALPLPFRETIIPVAVEEGVHRTESLSHVSEESLKSHREARTAQKQQQQQQQQQQQRQQLSTCFTKAAHEESRTANISLDSSTKQVGCSREHIIPVVVEEQQEHVSESHSEGTTASVENTQMTQNRESLESSHVCGVNTAATATAAASETETTSSETQSCNTAATENHVHNAAAMTNSKGFQAVSAAATTRSEESRNLTGSLPASKTVPISLKGDFFSDSFFEDMRKQFTSAVQDVLQQSDAACLSDGMTRYRNHLRSNRRLENQAVHVEEDMSSFKIILDVHEFVGGELKVEVENERALVVEGQASCEEGASSSTLTFRRIFSLPSQANVAAITSALSSDGVLIIFTPKLQQDVTSTASHKMTLQNHSRQEDNSGAASVWGEQQVRQEATRSGISFSKTSSSSSGSSSTTTTTTQGFSSQNVF